MSASRPIQNGDSNHLYLSGHNTNITATTFYIMTTIIAKIAHIHRYVGSTLAGCYQCSQCISVHWPNLGVLAGKRCHGAY